MTLPRYNAFDTDSDPAAYLSGFAFTIVFADGLAHTFSWDEYAMKEIGMLYQQFQYFSAAPILTIPRPVDYYEFVSAGPAAVPSMSKPVLWLMLFVVVGFGGIAVRRLAPRTD